MTDTAVREYQGIKIPAPGTFSLDPAHTRVGFVARHLMVSKVRGSFNQVSGKIVVTEDPADSSVEASIVVESVSTGVEQRDNHLRSADFFEAQAHPTIEFASTSLLPKGGNEFVLRGDLTIKNTTVPVELDVEFDGVTVSPYGKEVFGFSATGEIDREAFGITYNMVLEAGGVMIGNKVKLEIEGEAIRN
ncbi:MAG TPA: YceI family protein [Micromonosporaceae bacterium]|jgi:polyisoprenoid-binding protein YceI|nr:YceI family protein [Micromonosporaceae bacterium]